MQAITFFDTEISAEKALIVAMGAVKSDGAVFHSSRLDEFEKFLANTTFLCGHNVVDHDLKYLKKKSSFFSTNRLKIIDTLYLSPLLFPKHPYHKLLKDDKLTTHELNNPVNDSKKTRDLFYQEVLAFNRLDENLKNIYYKLLCAEKHFSGFFDCLNFQVTATLEAKDLILQEFNGLLCCQIDYHRIIENSPVELAYALALINCNDSYSMTPPWVVYHYPQLENLMAELRNQPCGKACDYCNSALDIHQGLNRYFGFQSYRKFANIPLQENAVAAAVKGRSLLALFPTGGGKSLTFQIPALMAGENCKGLTVILSPLQSLMKDQVDNLEKKGITQAVTINGLLDPIERSQSLQRVAQGQASLLYISPESLRSKTIERLLLGRNIVRFVIDEAHCFSSWGQDFRVDYLYIAEFIKKLQEHKKTKQAIPVSCFTATAKPKVVADIIAYFKQNLGLDLALFSAKTARKNLQYKVYDSKDDADKYSHLRQILESNPCPTIVYVSRTKRAYQLAQTLADDGFDAKPYHGKMDKQEKTSNQNDFIAGKIQIMVATSAFGMGVDKSDIGVVVHYDISDSLENYVQESGRAGRDQSINADCYILFNEEDLHKHFVLLNQTKLSIKEIGQIWRAIKSITKFRKHVSNSALEIARLAGWDDNVLEIETRVITAIAALEQAGYLKRGQNNPRIFANSILAKNAQQAIETINQSHRFSKQQKVPAIRIIKKLFSSKSRKHANDEVAEARIDYISDHLGLVKEQVIKIITLLREENILADSKDLTAFIQQGERLNLSLAIVKTFAKLERFLLSTLNQGKQTYNIKELNEAAQQAKCQKANPQKIKTVLNFWKIQNWIKVQNQAYSSNHLGLAFKQEKKQLSDKLEKRHALSEFIVSFMFDKNAKDKKLDKSQKQTLIEFSVHELKDNYLKSNDLFAFKATVDDIEDALFYLSRIGAIKIEGGFLVIYNKLSLERLQHNNKIQYKKEDYKSLEQFYLSKMQQIHIVGEYAKKMLKDYKSALAFVEDYFELDYRKFLNKYFKGSRKDELDRNITPQKFRQLFAELSPRQLAIINDSQSDKIVVAAGPGSGKTRVLVHKLASLLLMEDVKHEALLMLTFSRAATTEFKARLLKLIGNAANYIEIKTFHSYCFDLLGRVGNIEKSSEILQQTVKKIKNGEVEINRICKAVLVIDEAQDMDKHEFALIKALLANNPEMRVIAVGDDDQNIYAFRGADSKYFEQLRKQKNSKKYELVENYRSKSNLVEYCNQFVKSISKRFKSTPIVPVQLDNGDICIHHYRHNRLLMPAIETILTAHTKGTSCLLTTTNNQALQATGLLLKNKKPAKLIQSHDGFNLYQLDEIRTFIRDLNCDFDSPIISEQNWQDSKKLLANRFSTSRNYSWCKQLIGDFENTHPKVKYRSDFENFIRESKLEDFIHQNKETVTVSTIHKAKGKEFDHVHILLADFKLNDDNSKRQLYVAMTRAKKSLTIHTNGDYLQDVRVVDMHYMHHQAPAIEAQQLHYHLTHKDVQLGYFQYIQTRINALLSGQDLQINAVGLLNNKAQQVVKFSKAFNAKCQSLLQQGYQLSSAQVNFILYWQFEDKISKETMEVKILLPQLCFEKFRKRNFGDTQIQK